GYPGNHLVPKPTIYVREPRAARNDLHQVDPAVRTSRGHIKQQVAADEAKDYPPGQAPRCCERALLRSLCGNLLWLRLDIATQGIAHCYRFCFGPEQASPALSAAHQPSFPECVNKSVREPSAMWFRGWRSLASECGTGQRILLTFAKRSSCWACNVLFRARQILSPGCAVWGDLNLAVQDRIDESG